MAQLTALRICFYEYAELPSQERQTALAKARQEAVAAYGEAKVKETLEAAQRVIDNQNARARGGHLPYAAQTIP